MSDETRGTPLWQEGQWEFYSCLVTDEPPTHTAYTVAEARLLEDIVEAAREHVAYADERSRTRAERALDALAAHRQAP